MEFLAATVLDPRIREYPLKWTYQISFLKQCISILESLEIDLRDEFYETLVELQSRANDPQIWIFKHYILPTEEIVTIKETPQIISEGTTGLNCWEAGIFLGDWILSSGDQFVGKRILELGSGTGLTGIIAARTCTPGQLILSDCHEQVLKLARENVALNGCQNLVQVVDLNWDSPTTTLDEYALDPEIIFAADIVYDDTVFRPLVDLFSIFLNRNSAVQIYLAATVRNEATLKRFLDLIESSELSCNEVSNSRRVRNTLCWNEKTEIKLFLIKGH